MKIQCDRCKSTYNIDNDKIPKGRTEAKCSKCQNIIPVMKDEFESLKVVPKKRVESDEKKCPYCAEIIKADAIKCRFCREWLDQNIKKDEINQEEIESLNPSELIYDEVDDIRENITLPLSHNKNLKIKEDVIRKNMWLNGRDVAIAILCISGFVALCMIKVDVNWLSSGEFSQLTQIEKIIFFAIHFIVFIIAPLCASMLYKISTEPNLKEESSPSPNVKNDRSNEKMPKSTNQELEVEEKIEVDIKKEEWGRWGKIVSR